MILMKWQHLQNIGVPIFVFECTFDETASYELASEITKSEVG